MLRLSAAHVPEDLQAVDAARGGVHTVAEHDDVQVVAPALEASGIAEICARLAAARARIADAPVSRIIRAVDAAARRLLDPAEPERIAVLQSLHSISGFSPPMAEHLLDRAAQDWLAPQLETLVREELGGPAAVESFIRTPSGRRLRVVPPPLGLHVFAGNVPGVGVTSVVRALLVRSAVLGKSAAAEPTLTAAFARLLAAADPDIGACVAVTYWPGGDTALEKAALERVGIVVHYGGEQAIADLRARAPAHLHFVDHGPRISFAIIDAGAPTQDAARDLARAVALFDQQGCVSPQLAYVIGSADRARDIAAATASALDSLRDTLPRGRITTAEAAAIRELRTRAEFAALGGRGGELFAPHDLAWTVILSAASSFEGSCLNRTLLIKPAPRLEHVLAEARPFGHLLQTVGITGFRDEQYVAAAAALADIGASRITSVAAMPFPPVTWQHDGRGPLRELVQWAELESG